MSHHLHNDDAKMKLSDAERETDVDSVIRPSIYPQGRHLPAVRKTVLEEYYGGKGAELEILTELKSHRLEGFYNLCFLILAFALTYLVVRNIREYGWLPSLTLSCPLHFLRDIVFFFKFWLCLVTVSLSSLGLIKLHISPSVGLSVRGVLLIHYVTLIAVYGYSAKILMSSPVNPLFGAALGTMIIGITLKMHSYIATNLLLASEMKQKKLSRMGSRKERSGRNGSLQTADKAESRRAQKEHTLAGIRTKDALAFPKNVTLENFVFFLLFVPQLVYETSYPRSNRIRGSYVVWHCIQMAVCIAIQYLTIMQFMVPVFRSSGEASDYWFLLMKLAIPSFTVWLLFFFAFFHSFLNALAELARFEDRCFYLDWWNSTTIDSFWRKWNLAVHEWCLRHILIESVFFLKVKRSHATLATFFLSAMLHEYVFVVGFKVVRPYIFIGMLVQLPLIKLSQLSEYKGKRRGNLLMWIQLFLGHPMIELLYFHEYFKRYDSFFCI